MSPASRSYRLIRYLAALTIVSYSLPHASASDAPGKLPQLHKQQQEQEQEQQEHSSAQRIPLALEEDVDVAVLLGPESFTELGANPLQDPNATEDSKGALDDLIAELEEQVSVPPKVPSCFAAQRRTRCAIHCFPHTRYQVHFIHASMHANMETPRTWYAIHTAHHLGT